MNGLRARLEAHSVPPDQGIDVDQKVEEMKESMYNALEALETKSPDYLITVRQCGARIQASANEVWKQLRKTR